MTSHRLRAYLELERQMLALDAVGDHLADLLRESMDPLWYGLTEEEHAALDARIIATGPVVPLRTPAGTDLFLTPPRRPDPLRRTVPLRAGDWECAA